MNLNQLNQLSEQADEQKQNQIHAQDESAVDDAGDDYAAAESGLGAPEQSSRLNKGTAMVGAMVLVAASATFVMYLRGGPEPASANPGEAGKTISTFLDNGEQNIRNMEQMLQDTQRIVDQALTYNASNQVPLEELDKNPFRHESNKPKDAPADDTEKRREEERLAALKAVQALQLQSILHSDARKAVLINGTLYVEGQEVGGFAVQKINPGSVIVQKGEYRFDLKMQR